MPALRLNVFIRRDGPEIDAEAVMEALENPHDRQILALSQDRPMAAQEIIEATGIPKSTAYRRIKKLQEMGLIVVDSGALEGGHAIERYRAQIEMAALHVEQGNVEAHWRLLEKPDERLYRLWHQMAGG